MKVAWNNCMDTASVEYDRPLPDLFSQAILENVKKFHMGLPGYKPSALHSMPNMAEMFGIGDLYIKDESGRFGLQSFKALGATWAVKEALCDYSGEKPVFATATDGNHGRGVAWAASLFGARAVVHMPAGSKPQRVDAIRALGAECLVTTCNYDKTVQELAELAVEKDWILMQDTAWPGYEYVPGLIMQGYGTIVTEIIDWFEASGTPLPTHILLQAGVGSFAAAIMAGFAAKSSKLPVFVIVEPDAANCIYESMAMGEIRQVNGPLETIMAGLACGRPSALAWPIIRKYALAALSGSDSMAECGMRLLADNPDGRIIAGESGASTTGALIHLLNGKNQQELRTRLKLDKKSRVLLINTEGATDLESWQQITGKAGCTSALTP